jgi:hypothetical protein
MKKRNILISILIISLIFLVSCTEQISDEELDKELEQLSEEELEYVFAEDKAIVGEAFRIYKRNSKLLKLRRVIDFKRRISICTDTDDGRDYLTKGTVSEEGKSFIDTCQDSRYLFEYDCGYAKGINFQDGCGHSGIGGCRFDCQSLGGDYACEDGACMGTEGITIDLLDKYNSLSGVKSRITEINGMEALEEILDTYDPYESIAQKENKLNAIFQEYGFDEEERIYLIHVAHALWIENSNVVPWSLRDYSQDEIVALLERSTNLFWLVTGFIEEEEAFNYGSCWRVGNASKDWYKTFSLAKDLIEDSENQLQATEKIIGWVEKNFLHAQVGWGWEETYGYSRDLIRPTLEELFRERIGDCQTTTVIVPAMLRSINIPAYQISQGGHGVVYMPSLDLYIHGDFIADYAAIPASDLLMTRDELLGWTLSERDYLAFNDDIYHNRTQYNLKLKREGNFLYIDGAFVYDLYGDYWDKIRFQLWEYDLSLDGVEVVSSLVRIKDLDELTSNS